MQLKEIIKLIKILFIIWLTRFQAKDQTKKTVFNYIWIALKSPKSKSSLLFGLTTNFLATPRYKSLLAKYYIAEKTINHKTETSLVYYVLISSAYSSPDSLSLIFFSLDMKKVLINNSHWHILGLPPLFPNYSKVF